MSSSNPAPLTEADLKYLNDIDHTLWRIRCQLSLVEYARTIPIPGAPQSDNVDELEIAAQISIALAKAETDAEREAALAIGSQDWDDTVFTEQIHTDLADHHILILQTCQDLVEGELIAPDGTTCRRVMLFFPPGSAKSTFASVVFPTWYMGRYPDTPLILTGYADSICKKHGKRARQICATDEYQAIFETTLDPATKAADNWAVTNGSSYLASGLQSGLTGNRARGLIWDDPVKGRQAAESEVEQESTWDAYKDDARTRKGPGSWELGIQTRWHENDLAGRILPEGWAGESGYIKGRDGNWWRVLCVQAQAEHPSDPLQRPVGSFLWPEWFNEEGDPGRYWEPLKLDPRSWGSLYQQRPSPAEGLYFKKRWFKRYATLPEYLDYYIAFDPAVTGNEDGDSTAIQVWGIDQHARLYLVDAWTDKVTMDVWIEWLVELAGKYRPLEVVSESGVIRRAAEPYIKRQQIQTKTFFISEWVSRTADKSAMARSSQAMAASGQVYVPDNSIGNEFVDECLRFPNASEDHRVDAFANLCMRLEAIWAAAPPRNEDGKPVIVAGVDGIPVKKLMPPRFEKAKTLRRRR